MLSKLLNLLEPLKGLKNKANVLRLGLAGVVLGVGGFAAYKGAQQMKPSRPAPKKTVTAANQAQDDAGLDPTKNLDPTVATADSYTAPGGESGRPAYGGYGGSYGAEANPAAAAKYTIADQPEATIDNESSIPGSPMENVAGQSQYSGSSGAEPAGDDGQEIPRNLIRPSTRPSTSAYSNVTDNGAGSEAAGQEQPVSDQGGASADGQSAPAAEGTIDSQPAAIAGEAGTGAYNDRMEEETTSPSELRAPATLPPATPRRSVSTLPRMADEDSSAVPQPLASEGPLPASSVPPGRGSAPGERHWEGTQTPSIALEKSAPSEIQVGKSATFEIRVRNVGQVAAYDCVVTDHVPEGTRLEATNPQAQATADGGLAWRLGEMQPGDEAVLSMQVVPEQEGEIGSVAHVTFAGRATARSICTRPLLAVEHTAPKQILIGETARLAITITNPGTGAASGVIVEEDVPEALTHVAGSELEYEIGTLRPGETRQLELQLTAAKPGVVENVVTVRGEGNLIAQHKVAIEVIAPQLDVAVAGPKKRYLERQATYTLSVANPGTAAARSVELVAFLPRGMKFASTDAEGQYDPTQHAVFWSLEELPANKSGSVKLVTVPVETGEQKLRVEGRAALGLAVSKEQVVQVEARSELVFDIVDESDPIEVGTDTTYEVRVANNGTRPATNVELAAGFPAELKPVSAEGHSRGEVKGQQVVFEPVGRINPGEEVRFRIHARGEREGDHVIAVQVRSAEFPTPVTREESTRVYVDR